MAQTRSQAEWRPSLGFHQQETAGIVPRRATALVVREASQEEEEEEQADEGRVRTLRGGLIDIAPCIYPTYKFLPKASRTAEGNLHSLSLLI